MTYKVGDKVRYRDFGDRSTSDVPAGTKLLTPDLARVLTLNPAGKSWIFEQGVIDGMTGFIAQDWLIVFVPEPEPEADPIGDLAAEMWDVRNYAVIGTAWEYHAGPWKTAQETVYRALAEFVLGREKKTSEHVLIDSHGGEWVLQSDGTYRFRRTDGALSDLFQGYTRERIEAEFGPVTVR